MSRASEKKHFSALSELNRVVREGEIGRYRSENLKLGMRPASFEVGASRWTWDEQPSSVLNHFGTIQGGYLGVFADELFATAIASVLDEGEWAVTIEVKLAFMRALAPGPIEGSARVVHRSRGLAFLEALVSSADGQKALAASSTWAIRGRA
jgi:uncharacterized protein (TIGR00369 family)